MRKYMQEAFNPYEAILSIENWIKIYFAENGPFSNAIVGISGGKDSTVTAALLVRALGRERVIGVLMPDGIQKDIQDSYRVCELLHIKYYEVNIGNALTALRDALPTSLAKQTTNDIYTSNTPARIRMTVLYGIAGLESGRVANTCNFSEDFVGYSTKWGDNVGDFGLLAHYTVSEVLAIGRALGIPDELINKTPADGMSGMSDAQKLGFSCEELDRYILDGVMPENAETFSRIVALYDGSRHKRKSFPVAMNPFQPMYANLAPEKSYCQTNEHEFRF